VVCGRLIGGLGATSYSDGMQVHFVWCSQQSQRRADHSVTGVLPAVCLCACACAPNYVWSRNLNGGAS